MPIKNSAKKEMRKSITKTLRNRQVRGSFRSAIKAFQAALQEKKFDEAKDLFIKVQKSLDKGIQKNVIKKNAASRKKSRLSKALKEASAK